LADIAARDGRLHRFTEEEPPPVMLSAVLAVL
jgi:hypothetical protein